MFRLVDFYRDETGATAIEYALIAAGIAMAIVTVVATLGSNLAGAYQRVANSFH